MITVERGDRQPRIDNDRERERVITFVGRWILRGGLRAGDSFFGLEAKKETDRVCFSDLEKGSKLPLPPVRLRDEWTSNKSHVCLVFVVEKVTFLLFCYGKPSMMVA
jgi:hypothetical protein